MRYEKRKQEKREYTARKKAGLLTPEEIKTDNQRLAKNRARMNEWRQQKQAAMPPKPPKQPSKQAILKDIIARKKEGFPLTRQETEIYAAHREKENEKFRKRRAKIKANTPPKPEKLTTTAVMEKWKAGCSLTQEEQALYDVYREMRRGANNRQYAKRKAAADLPEAFGESIVEKRVLRIKYPLLVF